MDYKINYNTFPNNTFENTLSAADIYKKEQKEKSTIRFIGSISGVCVIMYVLLENLLTVPILFSHKLADLYKNSDEFFYMLTIILSIVCIMLPFLAAGKLIHKKTGAEYLLFDKPKDMSLAVYGVGVGIFACLVGNFVTTKFVTLMNGVGFNLSSPEMNTPSSVTGRILYVIAVAFIPPLAEEVAIRGCIMQPLRKYGDKFAIIASSLLFALLHGNLVQAPFAFIAGIAMGYVCCITNSLWPTIIIHFINNLYSVAVEIMLNDLDGTKLNIGYFGLTFFLVFLSVTLTLLFIFRLNHRKLGKPAVISSVGSKFSSFILNVPMLVAIIIMLAVTAKYIEKV